MTKFADEVTEVVDHIGEDALLHGVATLDWQTRGRSSGTSTPASSVDSSGDLYADIGLAALGAKSAELKKFE